MANHMTEKKLWLMCEKAKDLDIRPDRLKLLDKRLREWVHNGITPSIAVRVLRHKQLAFEGAYGPFGPGKEPDSLTVDAIFPVCSITKPVVATLICIMQEEGLVDINHPVCNYLPEFTGDINGAVRIWHLLTHTSGIIENESRTMIEEKIGLLGLKKPDDNAPEKAWEEFYIKIREKKKMPHPESGSNIIDDTNTRLMLETPPTHQPREMMAYCSFGYQMLMMIIKKVSGKGIDEYAAEKLFKPLNMKDSHFRFPREKLNRYVTRSEDFAGSNWLNKHILDSESGGGGLKSTVYDMTQFGQMFLNGGILDGTRVLSTPTVREMTSDHNSDLPPARWHGEYLGANWGLGWNIKSGKKDDSGILRSPRAFDHCGYCCCNLTCDPDTDIVLAFFTVSKTDSYTNSSHFQNMVFASIND